jgi:hypothetical protein
MVLLPFFAGLSTLPDFCQSWYDIRNSGKLSCPFILPALWTISQYLIEYFGKPMSMKNFAYMPWGAIFLLGDYIFDAGLKLGGNSMPS